MVSASISFTSIILVSISVRVTDELNSNSDMLKEAASLEDYDETTALPKRRREEPPADTPSPHHQHANTSLSYANHTMAPSMAVTPMDSTSSGTSISPLAQGSRSAPNVSRTMPMQPMPMYNPALNPLATNWDLGNLLMMQMGYTNYQPNVLFNLGAGFAGQQANAEVAQMQQTLGLNTNNNPPPQQGNMNRVPLQQAAGVQPSGQGGVQDYASASPESFGNAEDLLSLFSDVPVAFRCVSPTRFYCAALDITLLILHSLEEWDAYLDSIGS